MRLSRKVWWQATAGLVLSLVVGLLVYSWWANKRNSRVDLSRGLIGRWAAEGAQDHLVAGAPANVTGAVRRVWGHSGPALYFAGPTAHVTVPPGPGLDFRADQDFSVMAWIEPLHAETSFGVMSIIEKRKVGGITTARGFSLHLEYGFLACQLAPAPGFHFKAAELLSPLKLISRWKSRNALAPVNRFISTAPDLRDGRFHHVALTLERSSKTGGKLYVDGVVVQTFDPTGVRGSLVNAEPLLIGTHPDTTLNCSFNGMIEDVRLYSRALSFAEIQTVAHEPARNPALDGKVR